MTPIGQHDSCQTFANYLANPDHSPPREIWEHLDHCAKCQKRLEDHDSSRNPSSEDKVFGKDLEKVREVLSTIWPDSYAGKAAGHSKNQENAPTIPGFDIHEKLGKGSSGIVWKAVQQGLNRTVALKIMHENSPSFKNRLEKESKILASIQHPHLLAIHAVGEWEGNLWMALEYCPGGSLAGKLDSVWDPHQAARFIQQVALSAQAVHEKGIIHRDIKPGNILVDLTGLPKLADFDLARNQEGSMLLSQEGLIMGTPAYMAPEQVRGQTVDCRADVHALGGVLYHLLTGRPPFQADSTYEVLLLAAHNTPKAPIKIRPDLPKDLDQICQKCLTKDPKERYATAADFAEDLGLFLEGKPVHASPLSTPQITWRWAKRNKTLAITGLAGLVALLLVAVISTVYAFKTSQFANELQELNTQLTNANEKAQKNEEISRIEAGRSQESERRSHWDMYVNRINQARISWESNDPQSAREQLDLCPYGYRGWEHQYLNTLFQSDQMKWLVHQGPVSALAISPSGSLLATGGKDHFIQIIDLKTFKITTRFQEHAGPIGALAFAAQGESIASGDTTGTICIWDPLTGQKIQTLKLSDQAVTFLAFSPDGKELLIGNQDGQMASWDLAKKTKTHSLPGNGSKESLYALSPDRNAVIRAGKEGHLSIIETPTLAKKGEIQTGASILSLCFTGDSRKFLTGNEKDELTAWDIQILKPTGRILGPQKRHRLLAVSPRPAGPLAISDGKSLELLNGTSGERIKNFPGNDEPVTTLAIHPNQDWICTGGENGAVRIWSQTNRAQFAYQQPQADSSITALVEDPKRGQLLCASEKGELFFFKTKDKNNGFDLITREKIHLGKVTTLDLCKSRPWVLSGTQDGEWLVWDLENQKPLIRSKTPTGSISQAQWDPLGKEAYFACTDGKIRVVETALGKEVRTFEGHKGQSISTLLVHPKERLVASGDQTGNLIFWDPETLKISHSFSLQSGITAMKLSFNGNSLLVACQNGTIYYLEMFQTMTVWKLDKQPFVIHSISFTPDDRSFFTAGSDGKIRLWNNKTITQIMTLNDHNREANQVLTSNNGDTVYSLGRNRTLHAYCADLPGFQVKVPNQLSRTSLGTETGSKQPLPETRILGFTKGTGNLVFDDNSRFYRLFEMKTGLQKYLNPSDFDPQMIVAGSESPDGRWSADFHSGGVYITDKKLQQIYHEKIAFFFTGKWNSQKP